MARPLRLERLTTIAVPVYKRLHFLPRFLAHLENQDDPDIELLISDNGENGDKVREIVQSCYHRPYRFRQNPKTVDICRHFNQIVKEARGAYFLILADDDEISPDFVSVLSNLLARYPDAALGFSRQEFLNEQGERTGESGQGFPEMMPGTEFVLATWRNYQFGFHSVSSFLARTDLIRACGGYPEFPTGTHIDDALVTKLALGRQVVFSPQCSYRIRIYGSSHGFAIRITELAAACRAFLRFLDRDRTLREFAVAHSKEWEGVRACLRQMSWQTYHHRWNTMYRERLSLLNWLGAAFVLPVIPSYYRKVGHTLWNDLRTSVRETFGIAGRRAEDAAR